METPTRTPVQSTLTDYFPNAYSRSAPRMAKSAAAAAGGISLSAAKKRLLLSEDDHKITSTGNDHLKTDNNSLVQCTPKPSGAGQKRPTTTKKMAKTSAKRPKTTSKTVEVTRSVASMISFGPKAVTRLDSFTESTTTTTTVEESKCISSPIKPTINIADVKARLKNCKNLAALKANLSTINDCAEKLKEFKSMKVTLFSPVKSSYAKSPTRKQSFQSPEKMSLSGLTMIPSPLKATGRPPVIPSKLIGSPYLAVRRETSQAVS